MLVKTVSLKFCSVGKTLILVPGLTVELLISDHRL